MKRKRDVLLIGVCLAVLAHAGLYFGSTASHRALMEKPLPELAWLKATFELSDTEYERIAELHAAYKPRCAEMCRRIDEIHGEMKVLLSRTNAMSPEITRKLSESSQVRLECQTMMLKHFLDVSRTMPPERGKRYLEWVQRQIFPAAHRMSDMSQPVEATHHHHP